MYEDKYENHFLNIVASREAFLQFAQYSATALAATMNGALQPLAQPLQTQVDALGKSVTARGGQDATGQSGTRTHNDIIKAVKQFARDTNVDLLQPKLRKQPAELLKVLPYGLSGLTAASKQQLPIRFAVFTEALESQATVLGAEVGQKARVLLAELEAITAARDATNKQKDDTIGALGQDWKKLCTGLWQVHCTTLAQFHETPTLAQAFFNYDLLPDYNAKRKAKRKAKAAL